VSSAEQNGEPDKDLNAASGKPLEQTEAPVAGAETVRVAPPAAPPPAPGPEVLFVVASLERLEKSDGGLSVKVQILNAKKTGPQKIAQGIKDIVPIFTSLAAVIVTVAIAYSTYEYNQRQDAVTQGDLKRSWLADFTDSDDGKRKLGAIKLAAYGDQALPAVKDALGITNESIRQGGVLTALTIYRSQPKNRPQLLHSLQTYFEDTNPTLRLGVLEFYIEASKELSPGEITAFLPYLKGCLGSEATNCSNEEGDLVLDAAKFLNLQSFAEAKGLLLGIIRNCPERPDAKYDAAQVQVVNRLPTVVENGHLTKTERDEIINTLRVLGPDASDELKGSVKTAIDRIQKIQGP
jgi:hypothetical protein